MNAYGKRHCPDPTRQDGTKSAESLVANEAIASLIKRVGDLEKTNEAFASQIISQQKQIKKLFALTTKMRAFCIRGVHESTNQYKHWEPGRSSSVKGSEVL